MLIDKYKNEFIFWGSKQNCHANFRNKCRGEIKLKYFVECQDIGCANILCYKAYAKIIVYVLLLFRIYYLEFL